MGKPEKMTEAEVAAGLEELPAWTLLEGKLHRELRFNDFVEAFGFMTRVALVAEMMNHHPEWYNVYSTVIIDLRTHSADGISALDFELARRIDALPGTPA